MFPPTHDHDLWRTLARDRAEQLRADWQRPLFAAAVRPPRPPARRRLPWRTTAHCTPCPAEPEPS